MERISPQQLKNKPQHVVIDVREYPEFAAGAIPDALLTPLDSLKQSAADWDRKDSYVLVCKSGQRSGQGAETLAIMGFSNIAVLEGGTDAWIGAGFPVQTAAHKPWSLERQVRAIAGTMIVLSTALGLLVSGWFFAFTLFVGAGLLVAGVTDLCLMARLLGRMPWNRPFTDANQRHSFLNQESGTGEYHEKPH
jgi:rhodanese-related sulfurtransferase